MKKYQIVILLILTAYILFSSFLPVQLSAEEEVPFPKGYRSWAHVKTYIVRPKNPAFPIIGGFNHVYANKEAMRGYETGHFPTGSIIVSDVIQANEDSINTREGDRIHLDVMVRDSLKYSDFGGWRFETFDKNSVSTRLLTPETRIQCTNCHKRNPDMVFSDFRK